MGEMDSDFEEMMRMRNEAKKRLEEQFKRCLPVRTHFNCNKTFIERSKTTSNIPLTKERK